MPKQKTSSQSLLVGCNKRSALHRIDRNKVLNLSLLIMIVMMVCLAFATPRAYAQAMCAANQGGTPNCSNATAPASLNMTPVNVGVGNPINLITGNKYQQETDMPALPGVLGLEIIRHYNSVYSAVNSQRRVAGRGWRLSYETELYVMPKSIQIIQADSSRLIFPRDATDPSRCAHPNPAYGQIKIQETAQGKTYQWRWPNGRRLDFNPEGKLVQILAPTGEFVSLQYDPKGWLLRVTDPQGRMLRFNYLDQKAAQKGDRFSGLQSIDSPVGRFSYSYGSPMPKSATIEPIHLLANLVKVNLPTHYDANQPAHPYANRGVSSSSISRTYHYEDANHPTLLTGISITGQGSDNQLINQRISTYGYDINGKAILSMKANGAEKVTLDRSEGGTTILTNSLGQRTTYKHAILAGEYRLLEARGPGCTSCGQTNMQYGYDKLGQLIEETTLNASGQPIQATKTDRDAQGRIIQISNISYQNGKAKTQTKNSQWQRRYEYQGTNTEPSLIAQPSVVSGKESITKITYNAQGQPTVITQSGYSPAIGNQAATQITRTTTYRYSTDASATPTTTSKVGELSTYDEHPANRWMEIDGPINSDITRIEYDPKTKLVVKTIAPGNVVTDILERDQAGFPQTIETSDGIHAAQRVHTSYNGQGQLTHIAKVSNTALANRKSSWWHRLTTWFDPHKKDVQNQDAHLMTHISYDAHFRPHRLTRPDGTWSEIVLDAAGRITGMRDQDGNTTTHTWNSESQLLATLMQSTAPNVPLQMRTQYEYDQQNHLARSIAANSAITSYTYDSNTQQLINLIDPLKRKTDYQYDALGRLTGLLHNAQATSTTEQALTQFSYSPDSTTINKVTAANGATTHTTTDDFGRTLIIDSPDSGKQTAHYDAADRLIKTTNANGNQTEYVYNAAGQIISRTTTGKDSNSQAKTESVSYRYEGQYLKSIANPHQTTDYTYDVDGRVVQTVTCLTRPQANALCFTNKTTYDALGRVQSETLASGETIQFNYDKASRPIKIELVSIHGSKPKILATDIQIHPWVGISSFTHGNGIKTHHAYKQDTGQLTRLSVIPAQATSPLYAQSMAYDIAGRITGITRRGNNEQYGYDNLDHLSQVDTPHEKTAWGYDTVGNRLTQSQDHTLIYKPASNQLTAINQAQNQIHYDYDASGNPTQIGQKSYGYGITGRLQQVSQSSKVLARYAYNAQGERISKTVINANGQANTTYFLYHGHQLDAEIDANGTVRAHYVYLNHIPIAKIEYPPKPQTEPSLLTKTMHWLGLGEDKTAGRIDAIHTDHLGTPQLVTDDQQKTVWQANYTAFGKATVTTEAITLNLRLPGQYFDQETGTHYNYFRDYEPETGRYLTSDPIGLAGGVNNYSYVGGDPISGSDPFGLYTVYWGGAGLNGLYIDNQIKAFQEVGVVNLVRGGGGNGDTILDAAHVAAVRYQGDNSRFYDVDPESKKLMCPEQTNYIGYSYGSLLAAHTALYWANNGRVINNLVLVGSPIDSGFLATLKANKNIKNVLIYDLRPMGDPIYAGMTAADLASAAPLLGLQLSQTPRRGHFYYNPDDAASLQIGIDRRKALAGNIYRAGIR